MSAERSNTLFETLRDSGLLEPRQLEEFGRLPEAQNPDPRVLGRLLVQRGLCTKFQIGVLAHGKAKDLLVGPYRLLDRLGEGGMGSVFKAQHQHMNRIVALKVIRKEKLNSPDAVKRFYQEVQAAAKLQHPNIALAFDAGPVGQNHFFSMEYVEGTDLAALVKEQGPLPVTRACEYVRQAALGLQHAHEMGMVHRDVKPHNLMVTRKGEVKILDFGLARLSGLSEGERNLTQTGAVIGTPDYLAPEQAMDSRAANVCSDLYSLGCTLYFLLVGRAPFHAESLTQLLLKHQMETPKRLSQLRTDVPEELDEVMERLLAKKPAERYQSPAELARALEPFAQGGDAPVPAVVAGKGKSPAADESWATIIEESEKGQVAKPARNAKTPPEDRTLTENEAAVAPKAKKADKSKPGTAKRPTAQPDKKLPILLIAGIGGGALTLVVGIAVTALVLLNFGNSPSGIATQVASHSQPPNTSEVKPTQPANKPPSDTKPVVNPPPPPPPMPDPKVEAAQGQELARLPIPEAQLDSIHSVAFTPDGRRLVGLSNKGHYWWDAQTYRLGQSNPPLPACRGIDVLPDSRRFLTFRGRVPVLADVETGALIQEHKGHPGNVNVHVVSADGRRFIIAGATPEIQDGKIVQKNGKNVWHDTDVRVREVETGKEVAVLARNDNPISKAALSADGKRGFVLEPLNEGQNGVIEFDAETGRERRRLAQGPDRLSNFAVTPDGRLILEEAFKHALCLWDAEADQLVRPLEPVTSQTTSMAVSPGGRYLLTAHYRGDNTPGPGQTAPNDTGVRLWDLTTGKLIRQFDGHTAIIWTVNFSPDASKGVSASQDKTCRVWDLGVSDPADPARVALAPDKARPGARSPVPEEAKQAQAEKLVKDLYKDDYAKTKPPDKQALAQKLLEKGRATKDDLTVRFVLLREARDLAAAAADAPTALAAIQELNRDFDVRGAEMRLATLTTATKAVNTAVAGHEAADLVLDAVNDALADDDFDTVFKLTALVADLGRRLNSAGLQKRVQALDKDLRDTQKDFEGVKAARDVLKNTPEDAEAKATIGRYLCLRRGAWDEGLPYLAAGGDKVAAQAKKDLVKPTAAAEQTELADGWWDVAQGEQGTKKLPFSRRATYWYTQAVANLAGLNAERVDKRLQQIAEAEAALFPPEAGPAPRKLLGHAGPVNCVNFSADGKRAISGGDDRLVKVWDVVGGRELTSLDGAGSAVKAAVLSDKGLFAGAGSSDGWLHWWDVETRKRGNGSGSPSAVVAMETSPDGTVVVTGTRDGWIHLSNWRGTTNPEAQPRVTKLESLTAVCLLPEERVLAGDESGDVHWYDTGLRRDVQRFRAHKGAVLDVAASPDGKRCVTCGADKVVTVWDLSKAGTPPVVRQWRGLAAPVTCVAFLRDGRRFLTGGEDKTVRLWDVTTGRELVRFAGHTDKVNGLAISGDGTRALSAGADKQVLLWDLTKLP